MVQSIKRHMVFQLNQPDAPHLCNKIKTTKRVYKNKAQNKHVILLISGWQDLGCLLNIFLYFYTY